MDLQTFAASAALSDHFQTRPMKEHLDLLAIGFLGEIGSVLSEVKKMLRESNAYPAYESRITEEIGDALWYFARLCSTLDVDVGNLGHSDTDTIPEELLQSALKLAAASFHLVESTEAYYCVRQHANTVINMLSIVARHAQIDLGTAMLRNVEKRESRWPVICEFYPLFDDDMPVEDQIPRSFRVEFIERKRGSRTEVLLRYDGINIGSRLTDNISDADGYRYHDIFHMAHAVFLGWSPVTRSLLRCKRKSKPSFDENQDGARAIIIEEGVAAMVFSRAKHMAFFSDSSQIDYDLLKSIADFVKGYEVDRVPLWQWERAILEAYRIFRLLREHRGGFVWWDLSRRLISFEPRGTGV